MNLTFKKRIATFDADKIHITDEPLTVAFVGMLDGEVVVTAELNGKRRVMHPTDGRLAIPSDWLAPGKLCLTIEQYIGETLLCSWTAEPLLLIESNTTYTAIPELVAIEETLADHEKRLNGTALYDF